MESVVLDPVVKVRGTMDYKDKAVAYDIALGRALGHVEEVIKTLPESEERQKIIDFLEFFLDISAYDTPRQAEDFISRYYVEWINRIDKYLRDNEVAVVRDN